MISLKDEMEEISNNTLGGKKMKNYLKELKISKEQEILIQNDGEFFSKLKEFIDNSYDPNNISVETVKKMIDKDLPFYLKENTIYHFMGPEDQEKEYEKEFTFKEIEKKIDMSTYHIGFESTKEKDYNYLINMRKESYYSSQATVSRYELNQYLQTYLTQFKAYAEQKNIALHYKSAPEKFEVWIDRNKMDSILRNLISNALKYTPSGGEVRIEAGRAKNRWTLNIEDTGIGISKEDQKKLFRFLFRGRNATNQLITGSGIGMLLTYRLIRNHEGRISYTSTEGIGTTFTLSFPIQSERYLYQAENIPENVLSEEEKQEEVFTNVPRLANTQQTPPNAPHILIVEDNTSLRSFLAESLADTYYTEEAGNGQEALDKIHITPPDLVISDVMMPVMNGEEMCGILKSDIETSHIPVILLTALGTREDILRGLQTKADMHIVKPFDLTVLKANISNLLENREFIRKRLKQASMEPDPSAEEIHLPSGLDEKFIQHVTAFIKENLSGDLTVDTLCAEMNMSRTGFYNKMKALTGIPPNEFIRNIRMQEAAALLKSRQYTVAEVSDRMGFADPKYFADTFKKFYGVPPSVYKKNE